MKITVGFISPIVKSLKANWNLCVLPDPNENYNLGRVSRRYNIREKGHTTPEPLVYVDLYKANLFYETPCKLVSTTILYKERGRVTSLYRHS